MNLEYDDDETSLLHQAAEVFARIAPVPPTGLSPRPSTWPALVAAGWSDIGAAIADAEMSTGVGLGLMRAAGRHLMVEEFVSSAFLLSSLRTRVADPEQEAGLAAALRARPGVLLGDGRQAALPLVEPDTVSGFAFGLADDVDVYRLRCPGSSVVLERWVGPPAACTRLAGLSSTVGTIRVTGGQWRQFDLDMTEADVAALDATARLLHCGAFIGAAEQLVDLTCAYVRGRFQFGVPIGTFQAVKHGLADAFTALTVAWNSVLTAVADGADESLAPLVARLLTVDAAMAAARAGAQFHGGMGFTAESNVHLFLKAILDGAQRFSPRDDVAIALGRRFAEASC